MKNNRSSNSGKFEVIKNWLNCFTCFMLIVFAAVAVGCGSSGSPQSGALVATYSEVRQEGAGSAFVEVFFTSAGQDQAWFTSDDGIGYYSKTINNENSLPLQTVFYSSAGGDGSWFTVDDVISAIYESQYDDSSRKIKETAYTSTGIDMQWYTADDHIGFYDLLTHAQDGGDVVVRYFGSGPDGVWFTMDDNVSCYTKYFFDDKGNKTEMISYIDSGPDAVWFTADDGINSITGYHYDENNALLKEVRRYVEGDGDISAPDVINYYDTVNYTNVNGQMVKAKYYAGKTNSIAFSDGEMSYYRECIYDDSGKMTQEIAYSSEGDDSLWFTTDDYIAYTTMINYDDDGNIIRTVRYVGNQVSSSEILMFISHTVGYLLPIF